MHHRPAIVKMTEPIGQSVMSRGSGNNFKFMKKGAYKRAPVLARDRRGGWRRRKMGKKSAIHRWRRVSCLGVLPVLASCTVGPDFHAPKPWWQPSSYTESGAPGQTPQKATPPVMEATAKSVPVPEPIDPRWWDQFQDPELTSLEERLVGSNLDMRIASTRLSEARAAYGQARAGLFPTLNANGSITRELMSQKGVVALFGNSAPGGSFTSQGPLASGLAGTAAGSALPITQKIPPFTLYQYGFDASWELDLWGRVRRGVEAARANVQAAVDQLRDGLVSLEAEMARDYIQLRGVQRDRQIVRDNLQSALESLRLTKERATTGLTTDLDVANAQAQVDGIAAQLPPLDTQEVQLINAISQLLGQPPRALSGELLQPQPIPPVPPRVPVGVPAELARRRPDIRAAEALLHAATAQVGVAVASFFPDISLTGSFGFQTINGYNILDWNARQYGIGPTVILPIFQGGQLVSTLELREEQQKEAAINYQKTVLQALHEVDNALAAYASDQKRRDQLAQEVEAARRALDLARARYTAGVSTFLDVLTAQQVLLLAQQQLSDSTATVSTDLVALYKALGGGWEIAYPLPEARAGNPAIQQVRQGS
jgi:NodT family efflux transporter outer membrane factor (OMF) lipoprotein